MISIRTIIAAGLMGACAMPAVAQKIIAPTSATINAGGPGFGSINNTIDQSGLSSNYVSGVTDFNAYIATNPTHTVTFSGFEWFSNSGTTSATVTYDLGAIFSIDGFALWNEESSGIGTFDLLTSTDGINFFSILTASPIDNPFSVSYSAEVFNFTATAVRFARLSMSGCPQQPSGFDACAIGEVAFRTARTGAVPEPGTWAMMLLGFGGIGIGMRRRRRDTMLPQVA